MIDHLRKLGQHSNQAFQLSKERAGRNFFWGRGGGGEGAWQSKKLQDIVVYFFSTKGGGLDANFFTDTHYRSLQLLILLLARFAQTFF